MLFRPVLKWLSLFGILCCPVWSQPTDPSTHPSPTTAPASHHWLVWSADGDRHGDIDHQRLEQFLAKFVLPTQNGHQLNLKKVSKGFSYGLNKYLANHMKIPIREYTREEQLAYWINIHNAMVLFWVLKYFPIESIQDLQLSNDPYVFGPWTEKLFRIQGTLVSLEEIERRILRPIWQDNRIHYALIKTGKSHPLINFAVDPKRIDEQLDHAAKTFINGPTGVYVEKDKLSLPYLYRWYQADFGRDESSIKQHLKIYLKEPLKGQIDDLPIEYREENWELNVIQ